jgi:hypothetical protein
MDLGKDGLAPRCARPLSSDARWGLLLALVSVVVLPACASCGESPAAAPSRCSNTRECNGDEFCDRGTCAERDTQTFGHGYGAQCLPVAAYPDPTQLALHCRQWSCMSGHCSSCSEASECTAPASCLKNLPGIPGRSCSVVGDAGDGSRERSSPELPMPSLQAVGSTECLTAKQCKGDQFCDRGRCADLDVDQYGHGYGASCFRVEPPSRQGVCLSYLCLGHRCSSCAADSECYPEAPHCIKSPYFPKGRVCDARPESDYYDAAGGLRVDPDEYARFKAAFSRMQQWRAEVGLPNYSLP